MASTASAILAINAGSSSVKVALFTGGSNPRVIAREALDSTGSACVPQLVEWIDGQTQRFPLLAIGHRIVHGGPMYQTPQRITPDVLAALRQLIPFAPNHLPDEIALIEALQRHCGAIPHVACFDTAFHHDLPDVARRLPLPAAYDAQGLRRYGFHGLSYEFLMQELQRATGSAAAHERIILAHLGNGSSLAAIRDGRSVDTTMAFTPISGVVMSTRSGDLDPGVITHLARREQWSGDQLEDLLSHRAGLLAISGVSGDMRTLLAREGDHPGCRLAVAAYVYGIKKAIGAFSAVLGGIDTLVFAGGIGEHAAVVRTRICDGLGYLGLALDPARNAANEAVISTADARATVRVIATDEELMIARAVRACLHEGAA